MNTNTNILPILVATLPSLALACGDDAGSGSTQPETSGENEASSGDGDGDGDGDPIPELEGYLFCSIVFSLEGPSTLAGIVPSLGAGVTFDVANGLPLPGLAACAFSGTALYAGSGEGPEITRFDIDGDGNFTQGATVSFFNLGVPVISGRPGMLQVVEGRGVYFDEVNLQAVSWDPESMTIIESLSFADLAPADGTTFGLSPGFELDGKAYAVGGFYDPVAEVATNTTAVLEVDVSDNSIAWAQTNTCGGNSNSSVAINEADGLVYIANGARNAAKSFLEFEGAPAPCLTRFDPAQIAFDEAYTRSLVDLTGQAIPGELTAGPDGSLVHLAYDPAIVPITDMTADQDMLSVAAWRPHLLTDPNGAGPTAPIETLEPVAGAIAIQPVDGSLYLLQFAADFSTTTVVEVSDLDDPVIGATLPGAASIVSKL